MGEAKKRFASIEGEGAEKVAALSDADQAQIHETAAAAASAVAGLLTMMMSVETSRGDSTHGQGPNAIMSGGIHGMARVAWQMRRKGMARAEVARLLTAGITHGLEQAEKLELMGGPVAGHG